MPTAFHFSGNFGDDLNRNILSILCPEVTFTSVRSRCDLIAIGSILSSFSAQMTLGRRIRKALSKPVHVWGSGFLSDFIKRGRKFRRKMVFHALRGRLTKAQCEKLLGHEIKNIVLGDPGLLAWKLWGGDDRS